MKLDLIIKKVKEFEENPPSDYKPKDVDKKIKEFNKLFPKEDLDKLTLQEYSRGYPASFSWWVEVESKSVARIGGRSSYMFHLWSNPTDVANGEFSIRKGRKTIKISLAKAENEFIKVKNTLIAIVDLAKNNNFVDIDDIKSAYGVGFWPVVRAKVVFLYFPYEKITSIMSTTDLKRACNMFGVRYDNSHPIESNHRLLNEIKKISIFSNWDGYKIGSFFYSKLKEDAKLSSQEGANTAINIDSLLLGKNQIIFYGPPGTGKTYKAREFAVEFIEKGGGVNG